MKRSFLIALSAIAFATAMSAQNSQYVYFSSRFAETPASGRGGNQIGNTPPTHPLVMGFGFVNEAAVLNSPGIAVVRPGVPNMIPISTVGCPTPPNCPPPPPMVVDFVEIANIPQLNLEAGDTDNDGIYNEAANFAGVDAVWVPFPPANRAANLHEMFVSTFSDSAGALGYRGTAITEADVMLFPAAPNLYPLPSTPQAPIFFIRQSHLEVFFGMAPGTGNAIDTDGFCVDQTNGDIYISFDGIGTSAASALAFTGTFLSAPATPVTTTVHAGDVYRIPGTAYTPSGPYGVVTNPLPNLIERVYTQADVTTMVTTAGGCITNTGSSSTGVLYTNSRGISIDFTAGLPTTATPQGFVIKQLFFTIDNRGTTSTGCPGTPSSCQSGVNQNLTAAAIYSTQTGGSFAVINGTIMNQPSAVGMQDCSFNNLFFTGPLDAACVVQIATPYDPVNGGPFHLDNFPDSGYRMNAPNPTPVITGHVAGGTPGGQIAILGRADIPVAGSYVDRYSTLAFGIVAGFPDIFIDLVGINNASFLIAPYLLAPYGQNAAAQALFNGGPGFTDWNPIITYTDYSVTPPANNGDSAFSMDLTPLVGAVPFPFVLTFQAVDLSSSPLRLSDALSFEFVFP